MYNFFSINPLLKGAKNQVWRYHLNGQWYNDQTVQVECADQSSTPSPTDGTTTGSNPTITTPKPQPGDLKRTIIFVEKQTVPGSDVFIIGGQPDLKSSIDIKVNPMPEQWEEYNAWMVGDDKVRIVLEGPKNWEKIFLFF